MKYVLLQNTTAPMYKSCIDKVFCMHLSKQVVLFVLLVIFKSVRRYNIDLSDIILIYHRKEKKKQQTTFCLEQKLLHLQLSCCLVWQEYAMERDTHITRSVLHNRAT